VKKCCKIACSASKVFPIDQIPICTVIIVERDP
jgi:hypothetical protein